MGTDESGKDLRERLEEALAEKAQLAEENRNLRIAQLAGSKDFPLVTAEDLATAPEEMDLGEYAKQVQEREADRQAQVLKKAGLTEDQVKRVLAGETISPEAQSGNRIKQLVGTPGAKVPKATPDDEYHGYDAIRQHFALQDQ